MDLNTENSGALSMSDMDHNWASERGRRSVGGRQANAVSLLIISAFVAVIASLSLLFLGAGITVALVAYPVVGTVFLFAAIFLSISGQDE